MAKMAKPIEFTEEERAILASSAISMHSRLINDKHVPFATLDHWYKIVDKLVRAKIFEESR